MRCLHIIDSLGAGGAERALLNLLPALASRGVACAVAPLMPPYTLKEEFEGAGIQVLPLNVESKWRLARGAGAVVSLARSLGADVLHAHLYFSTLYVGLSRLRGGPPRRFVTYHNLAYSAQMLEGNRALRAKRAINGLVCRNLFSGHIAVSEGVAEHYRHHLGLRHVAVLPNALRTRDIQAGFAQEIPGLPPPEAERPLIVVPGRLVPEKGHAVLLAALKRLEASGERFTCLVAGDGPLRETLARSVAELGLSRRVLLLGALPHAHLLSLVARSDIAVVPSILEGFGLVAVEAMLAGRPVIASRVGGLKDIVREETGVLVEPGNASELAVAIGRLIADADLRRSLGAAGKASVEGRFDDSAVAARLIDLYGSKPA